MFDLVVKSRSGGWRRSRHPNSVHQTIFQYIDRSTYSKTCRVAMFSRQFLILLEFDFYSSVANLALSARLAQVVLGWDKLGYKPNTF